MYMYACVLCQPAHLEFIQPLLQLLHVAAAAGAGPAGCCLLLQLPQLVEDLILRCQQRLLCAPVPAADAGRAFERHVLQQVRQAWKQAVNGVSVPRLSSRPLNAM